MFPGRRKAIFVHGCFWHGHSCKKGKLPSSNVEYWSEKIEANRERDARVLKELEIRGWQAIVIWQCELANPEATVSKVEEFLHGGA